MDKIVIKGAREHNLKNVDVEIPRNKLVVISGLSGSGKSTLAFDTIFAEGQRRYMESLSSYARQFLGRMEKPDVDYISGLSPAISIEQKTTHNNPRSTVGTITEIYDYYRLLYARIGVAHCPICFKEIEAQTSDTIIEQILSRPSTTKLMILAPVVQGKKGTHQKVLEDALRSGFVRVKINSEIFQLDDEIPKLNKNCKYDIDIIVDRIKSNQDAKSRIAQSVETALNLANGIVKVLYIEIDKEEEEVLYSTHAACHKCGISLSELQPRSFSFNNPYGACPDCHGLGYTMEYDINKIIPDYSKSFNDHGILTHNPKSAWFKSWFSALADHYNFSLDEPIESWSKEVLDIVFNGSNEILSINYTNRDKTKESHISRPFNGIINDLKQRYKESPSQKMSQWFESFMSLTTCKSCNGRRLKPESLAVTVGGLSIDALTALSVEKSLAFFDKLTLTKTQGYIAAQIIKEIRSRLLFLQDVGLGYLTLDRSAGTLSGGEAQRIRLATQIGSQLVGVLYILDEPSIGLHQRDNDKLIDSLKKLRDVGNTLIVVEHDQQMLQDADYIIDMGEGAGIHGGNVIACGTPAEVAQNPKSITGQFLSQKIIIPIPKKRREGNGLFLKICGAKQNNLKNINVKIPLGLFAVITGVSGSGKSTLMTSILSPAVTNAIYKTHYQVGDVKEIKGIENIDKIITIDQSPIGRTPRSNPATYIGLFTHIRDLYASLPESKAKGYNTGRFSFNVSGGRCENCKGDGSLKIEMHFLSDLYVVCPVCKGKRYNSETLEVLYKGKSISDVLEMSVEEALEFFQKIPVIARKLQVLYDVGLGYIKLGQSALTLSGGEAQRVKLASELTKISTGKTLYILDEPTTGLHYADVKQLLTVLQKLVDKGNSLLLIEHNLDVIKQADYVIDLGPEGGDKGGFLVGEGTPEEIAKIPSSWTGKYLKELL